MWTKVKGNGIHTLTLDPAEFFLKCFYPNSQPLSYKPDIPAYGPESLGNLIDVH